MKWIDSKEALLLLLTDGIIPTSYQRYLDRKPNPYLNELTKHLPDFTYEEYKYYYLVQKRIIDNYEELI